MMRRLIQRAPLYFHILVFLAGLLTFSIPMIQEKQENYLIMQSNFKQVEEISIENNGMTYQRINQIFENSPYPFEIKQEAHQTKIVLNGKQVASLSNPTVLDLKEEMRSIQIEVSQIQGVEIIFSVVKTLVISSFISLVLIVSTQFMYRRTIKFKIAYKYLTIPVLIASFLGLALTEFTGISSTKILITSFFATSILFNLLCLKEFKRSMTSDYLGEETSSYGIY